jgi:hypothetical protein
VSGYPDDRDPATGFDSALHYTTGPKLSKRELLLDGSCSACLEGAHPACTGRVSAFGGACSCQIGQHATLLARPATSAELEVYLT